MLSLMLLALLPSFTENHSCLIANRHLLPISIANGVDDSIAEPITFPAFNTMGGTRTLDDVEIITNFNPIWRYQAENLSTYNPTSTITWQVSIEMNLVYRPNFGGPVCFNPLNTVGNYGSSYATGSAHPSLPLYDGVTDFSGLSGFSHQFSLYMYLIVTHANTPRELAWWSGTGPRTFYICPRFLNQHHSGFNGHYVEGYEVDVNMAPSVAVIYHWH